MEFLRQARFKPYMPGMGPTFSLTIWDTFRLDKYGKFILRYRLTQTVDVCNATGKPCEPSCYEPNTSCPKHKRRQVIFEGSDYCPSPSNAISGNESMAGLLYFLTLQPGDTDPDYFANYTPHQLAFASEHGEALRIEAMAKWGEQAFE